MIAAMLVGLSYHLLQIIEVIKIDVAQITYRLLHITRQGNVDQKQRTVAALADGPVKNRNKLLNDLYGGLG